MHKQVIDLGSDVKEVVLYPMGDLHIGSSHYDLKKIKQTINLIKDDPNAYCILNGDMINNNIVGSVGDIFTEKFNPQKQIDKLVDLFTPIKDKILSIVSGNHEYRTYKNTGIDIGLQVAKLLGIEHRYNPISHLIFLSFGKQHNNDNRHTFSIYHTHLAGGGKSVGNRANKLKELTNVIHADVYIGSHLHTPLTFKTDYFMTYNNNKTIKQSSRLYLMTNSYEHYNNFAEKYSMTPSTIEQPKLILYYNRLGKQMKGVV